MKLSMSWIFDHIGVDWKKYKVKGIIEKFNHITAEIDGFYEVDFDLSSFALGKVSSFKSDGFKVLIPEWEKEVSLFERQASDYCLPEQTVLYFLIKKDGGKIRWATVQDFGVEKEGLFPPVAATEKDLKGDWKRKFECKDVILEVDNKSITHRPDMWGHRGFAREIAAILDLSFLPEDKFLADLNVEVFEKKTKATEQNPISIQIQSPEACSRFAGLYFDSIENKPCDIFVASRLLKVGSRPINCLVDVTNYLMFDWGQPVHAYDAENIEGKTIIARMADNKEKLLLLDETELELTDKDLVIADSKKPLCLAGVMGGKLDSVGSQTKSLFLEAATFDSAFVRRTAMRHKSRTESSSRFEKTLDPNQAPKAIARFVNLAKQVGIKFNCGDQIVCVGQDAPQLNLEISHSFFEKRAGFEFKQSDIVDSLKKLEFEVEVKKEEDPVYIVKVPSFRSSKDIEIKEDILEEVVRFYGFENVGLTLPEFTREAYDLDPIFKVRKVKRFLANAANMMEQQNYAFYDEQNLTLLGFDVEKSIEIINSVSDNSRRMATSLIPNLLKNIQDNVADYDSLNFFELGRVWLCGKDESFVEQKRLAGIFFEKRRVVDFYECKHHIVQLLNMLGIANEQMSFKQVEKPTEPWFRPYQMAQVFVGDKMIGTLGNVQKTFLNKLDVLPESDAFIFDFDFQFLLAYKPEVIKFEPISKFQDTFIDLSVMVPLVVTTEKLEKLLKDVDPLITHVSLIDFFEKEEWLDQRSLTFRANIAHPEKTLAKDEIDAIWNKCVKVLEGMGAKLRI